MNYGQRNSLNCHLPHYAQMCIQFYCIVYACSIKILSLIALLESNDLVFT